MELLQKLKSPGRSAKSSRKTSRENSIGRREGEEDEYMKDSSEEEIIPEKDKPESVQEDQNPQLVIACQLCNIDHDLGECNVPKPSAPTLEKMEEQKQQLDRKKKAVREVAEINQLLNSKSKKIDGNRVMELLEGACEKLVEQQLQTMKDKVEQMTAKVNSFQIQKEDEIDGAAEDRARLEQLERKLNPCTPYVHNIAYVETPRKLSIEPAKKSTLDRNFKIAGLFKNVPNFKDEASFPVRLFLNAMTSTANNCPDTTISESEFYSALWNKLDAPIQTLFKTEQIDTIDKLYQALITNYDVSETPMEAFTKIQNLKPSPEMRTIKQFLTEVRRLNDLCQGTENERSRNFMIAMKSFLPHRLRQKLQDKVEIEYNTLYPGQSPPMQFLVTFLRAHNGEIQDHLDQHIRRKLQIRQVMPEVVEDEVLRESKEGGQKEKVQKPTNGKTDSNLICQKCGKRGHLIEKCWVGRICEKCGRQNHVGAVCKAKCKLCGVSGHGTVSCPIYRNQVPMGSRCSHCFDILKQELFHSEASCNVKDCRKN